MLPNFFHDWNPLNMYGTKVELEDLISCPLLSSETLMQDKLGCFRRIKVPPHRSSFFEEMIYWLQRWLNRIGHIEAMEKLISHFYQKLLRNPPEKTAELQEFISQIEKLRQLKNDHRFVHLQEGDPSFIDSRLFEIEQQAYSIFAYYYKKQVLKEEKKRKRVFFQFQKKIEKELNILKKEFPLCLLQTRFLIMSPPELIPLIFKKRMSSLEKRVLMTQDLHQLIDEIEKKYEGKFTILHLNHYLTLLRAQVNIEINKISLELDILIRAILFYAHLVPDQNHIRIFLEILNFNPKELKERKYCVDCFHKVLADEIKRIMSCFSE